MTRINTVHPSDLTNEWLFAEWRELPRIVNELEKHPQRYKLKEIPDTYRMNEGHVKFFRNKLMYLALRHRQIRKELKKRNINFNHKVRVNLYYLSPTIKAGCLNDWHPQPVDHLINLERFEERFELRGKPYYMTEDNTKTKIDCERSFCQYFRRFEKYLK